MTTTVTFREKFPTVKLGETRHDYNVRLNNFHARREAFLRTAAINGWVVAK